MQDEWNINCIVEGEAEDIILDLFERAVRGETLPKKMEGKSPNMDAIPRTVNRSTFGVIKVTRGCGRGFQFCSIALRKDKSLPLEHILDNDLDLRKNSPLVAPSRIEILTPNARPAIPELVDL